MPTGVEIRPSAICSCPEQKMLAGAVKLLNVLVSMSQTQVFGPSEPPSLNRTFELGSRLRCTETMGNGVRPDMRPVTAGLPGLALLKVTFTGAATPLARTPFNALAEMACVPLVNCAVFSEKLAGLVVAMRPTGAPSTSS